MKPAPSPSLPGGSEGARPAPSRRLLFVLPVLLFLGVAAYLAVGLTSGDPHLLPSALIDKPAPEFSLPGLEGASGLAKSDLLGHVTLVNFFASWCVPCRVEQPMLIRISHEAKAALVGIAYKDKPAASRAFLDQLGDPYKQIGVDREGRVAIDFGVYGVPETYVVDKQGRIRYRQVGPISADDYEHKLLPLLRELSKS
jgi:cytochrome c biogenesis protein CcmG/thiol:disulfide interchange protein DsbE